MSVMVWEELREDWVLEVGEGWREYCLYLPHVEIIVSKQAPKRDENRPWGIWILHRGARVRSFWRRERFGNCMKAKLFCEDNLDSWVGYVNTLRRRRAGDREKGRGEGAPSPAGE